MKYHTWTLSLLTLALVHRVIGHKRKGQLEANVRFANVHIFLSTKRAEEDLARAERMFQNINIGLLAPTSQEYLQRLKKRSLREIKQTKNTLEELVEAFRGRHQNALHRRKRSPMLIAAGIAAVVVIVTLGLAAWNRVDVENLKTRVEEVETDFEALLTTIKDTTQATDNNFQEIEEAMDKMNQRLTEIEQKRIIRDAYHNVTELHRELRHYMFGISEAVYAAYNGHLHPMAANVSTLEASLNTVRTMASTKGYELVPFSNDLESLFTIPIAVVTNATGIHLFVPVPLRPQGGEIFDVLELDAPRVAVQGGYFVELDVGNGLVATAKLNEWTIDLNGKQLQNCKEFNAVRLCSQTEINKTPKSCKEAILRHDLGATTELCERTVTRTDVQFLQTGKNVTIVRPEAGGDFTLRCKASQQKFKMEEAQETVVLQPGCFVETDSTIFYPKAEALNVYENVSLLHIPTDLMLDGIDESDLHQTVVQMHTKMQLKRVKLDLRGIRAHARSRESFWWRIGHSSLSLALLLTLLIFFTILISRACVLRSRRLRTQPATDIEMQPRQNEA